MARFCPLFSSSSGNCIYIGNGSTNILIDAGVSAKKISEELSGMGIGTDDISAIFVTHEHSDHISGLWGTAKKGIPVFASTKTVETLRSADGKVSTLNYNVADGETDIDGITVQRFATSHDCDGSSGYKITLPSGMRICICTDTGVVTPEIRDAITGCDVVMLESNHDINMLANGFYQPYLKKRILSEKGHLSNTAAAEELPELVGNGATRIVLGHLSKNNNTPELARETSIIRLAAAGFTEGEDFLLSVASPENNPLMSF